MPAFNPALQFLFDRFSVPLLSNVTGISLSSLYRYKTTKFIPTVPNYNTLFNRYRSVTYTMIRASGASTSQANRFKASTPSKIFEVIHKYQETAIRLATEYGVDVDTITENMSKSEKDYEEINESP